MSTELVLTEIREFRKEVNDKFANLQKDVNSKNDEQDKRINTCEEFQSNLKFGAKGVGVLGGIITFVIGVFT